MEWGKKRWGRGGKGRVGVRAWGKVGVNHPFPPPPGKAKIGTCDPTYRPQVEEMCLGYNGAHG